MIFKRSIYYMILMKEMLLQVISISVFLFIIWSIPHQVQASKGFSRPTFAEPIPNVTVAVGRDAALPCVVDNLGSFKVAWVHLDRQMIVTIHRQLVTRIPRFSVSHDHQRTWLLHIKGAQPEDAGTYMCQVNSDPMASQVGTLRVVVPPSIVDTESSPSQLSVRENVRVSLVCRAQGVPAPRVSWKREDGKPIHQGRLVINSSQSYVKRDLKSTSSGSAYEPPLGLIHHGEELIFPKVSRTDSGAYLCIATNGVPPSISKRIILEVEFPPMMYVPSQLIGYPLGGTVTLECLTEAQPRPITYWVRSDANTSNGVMLLPTHRIKHELSQTGYQTQMKLHISQFESQDTGNYKCISKNSLGDAEGTIRLYEVEATLPPTKQADIWQPIKEVVSTTINTWKTGYQGVKKSDNKQDNQSYRHGTESKEEIKKPRTSIDAINLQQNKNGSQCTSINCTWYTVVLMAFLYSR